MNAYSDATGDYEMRLLVLYTNLAPYIAACLRDFHSCTGAAVLVFTGAPLEEAPFGSELHHGVGDVRTVGNLTRAQLMLAAEEFAPDAVLVNGWRDGDYRAVARHLRRKGILCVCSSDNQWRGSVRQHLAGVAARAFLHPFFDVLWVTGERQRLFAARLGYRGNRCWDGFYAADVAGFSDTGNARRDNDIEPAFLFVGRYVEAKGIDQLATAYQRYRTLVDTPWALMTAGTGPLRSALVAAGATDRGFVQPRDLAGLMASATAFILPSRFEPWGVALHEAAAAGLPLVASRECGAAVHLIRDGFNGASFAADDVDGLLAAMMFIHRAPLPARSAMGARSRMLARQFTPSTWTSTLHAGITRHQESHTIGSRAS